MIKFWLGKRTYYWKNSYSTISNDTVHSDVSKLFHIVTILYSDSAKLKDQEHSHGGDDVKSIHTGGIMASKNTSTTSDGDAERLRRHYHLKHPLERNTDQGH